MYIPKYFKLYELLPPELYNEYSVFEGKGWRMFDDRLLKTLDTIKEVFPKGSMTVNNYYWGGNRKWSGLRTPDSPYYSKTSQHSFGRAADVVFSMYDESMVRRYIIEHSEKFPYIKGIEDDVSWLHIDCGNRGDTLQVFKG